MEIEEELRVDGLQLSARRRAAAVALRAAVEACLRQLAMGGSRFDVRISWQEEPAGGASAGAAAAAGVQGEGLFVDEVEAAAASELGGRSYVIGPRGLDQVRGGVVQLSVGPAGSALGDGRACCGLEAVQACSRLRMHDAIACRQRACRCAVHAACICCCTPSCGPAGGGRRAVRTKLPHSVPFTWSLPAAGGVPPCGWPGRAAAAAGRCGVGRRERPGDAGPQGSAGGGGSCRSLGRLHECRGRRRRSRRGRRRAGLRAAAECRWGGCFWGRPVGACGQRGLHACMGQGAMALRRCMLHVLGTMMGCCAHRRHSLWRSPRAVLGLLGLCLQVCPS